jgi:predicted deacetylase
VTPYIFCETDLKNYALKDDEEMIEYLKDLQDKGYELGMHGYNHCRNAQYCPKYEEVWYNVFKGKRELEAIFETPFVSYFPPGNEWTTEQYENVKKAGFKLIGNTHVPRAYLDDHVIITPKGYDPIYVYGWYARDFRHTSYDEWIDAYEDTNLFIIQLHPNTFDSQEKLDDLDKFLSYVKDDGAKVMTYEDFYYYIGDKAKKEGKDLSGNIILDLK